MVGFHAHSRSIGGPVYLDRELSSSKKIDRKNIANIGREHVVKLLHEMSPEVVEESS